MAKISTVLSISETRRAQFKKGALNKKTGQINKLTNSSQPAKIRKGKTTSPTIQLRRLNIAAFQQNIQAALKSNTQRKANVEPPRNIKSAKLRSFVNPLSANRTLKRATKINSLISRNRFKVKNAGSAQFRPRIKSLGQSEAKNQIKIPDSPLSSLKTGRINLLV